MGPCGIQSLPTSLGFFLPLCSLPPLNFHHTGLCHLFLEHAKFRAWYFLFSLPGMLSPHRMAGSFSPTSVDSVISFVASTSKIANSPRLSLLLLYHTSRAGSPQLTKGRN